ALRQPQRLLAGCVPQATARCGSELRTQEVTPMVVRVPRNRLWGLGALAVTLTLLGLSGRGQGQPPKGGDTSGYLGAKNCEGCHSDNGPRIYSKASQEFLMMTEHKTWKEHDLHSKGFEALSSPLGQQMGRILKEDVTKKPQCLTCHAV